MGRQAPALVSVRVAVIACVTAAVVALASRGEAFWLCIPAVLVACAMTRTRVGAAVAATAVAAAAGLPIAVASTASPPSPLLAVVVVTASTAVLIAVRERLERRIDALRDVALTDPLTGIANRRSLLARADYEVARHTRGRRRFALVMIDLDGFKRLNDRFGHPAGDELLCDVADALRRAIRGQDTVARIGGDEFCVLAPETDVAGTAPLAKRIAAAVAGTATGVRVRASIGIAVFPDDGRDVSSLLHAADERLLDAKRGRARERRKAA
jgi:diguanylate cyclase (GGDEF)-like protein